MAKGSVNIAFRAQLVVPEQRQLYDYWLSRTDQGLLPTRADINPADIPRLLPFISLISRRLEVLTLEAARDYRRDRIRAMPTWHVPADQRAERALDASFAELTGVPHGEQARLTLLGRSLDVPQAARGVARFDFDALCGKPLGPADYLAVATHFHTLVLDAVPRLGPENFDRARRFITLVDALYEHRVKLIASAAAVPDRLYEEGDNAAMFARTASRLNEMQSQDWLRLPHLQ